MNFKRITLILSCILIALVSYILYLASLPDTNDNLPKASDELISASYSLLPLIKDIGPEHLSDSFPYSEYLNHVSLNDVNNIHENLIEIDSFVHDPIPGQKILSLALTDSLFSHTAKRYDNYDADSLIIFMQTIESFKYFSKFPGNYQTFYDVVYTWWMSKISNLLDNFSKVKPNLKYSFKYRFLAGKCKENLFNVSPMVDEVEKVVNNISEQKWSYLYKRIWNAPVILRVVLFIAVIITILAYITFFRTLVKKIKK